MPGPQYTSCVDRKQYKDPNFTAEIILAVAGLVFALVTAGIALVFSLYAAMSALRKVCDYIMGGKLVCLGDSQCAIGRVTAFETVDEKSGFDRIDNDFSINMLLAPHDLAIFAQGGDRQKNYGLVANDGLQGILISERPDMPVPRETREGEWHSPRYDPTFTTFPDRNYITYNPFLGSRGIAYDVPILHCEIEGERAHAVCSTLDALSSFGIPGLCGFKLGPIPIGKILCNIIATLLAPIILAALAIAWAAGADDNRDVDGAGSLNRGECILIRGRWAYDAAHSGWNEIHAVHTVQRIPDGTCDWGEFQKVRNRWCEEAGKAPPDDPTGQKPKGMTPAQDQVYTARLRPENRWVFHPLVDGCKPAEEPPVIK